QFAKLSFRMEVRSHISLQLHEETGAPPKHAEKYQFFRICRLNGDVRAFEQDGTESIAPPQEIVCLPHGNKLRLRITSSLNQPVRALPQVTAAIEVRAG